MGWGYVYRLQLTSWRPWDEWYHDGVMLGKTPTIPLALTDTHELSHRVIAPSGMLPYMTVCFEEASCHNGQCMSALRVQPHVVMPGYLDIARKSRKKS